MRKEMKKPMMIMLISLVILFGGVFLYKGVIDLIMKSFFAKFENPTMTVSTTTVEYSEWQPQLKAVASTRTTLGVEVTAQLAGMITKIYFKPGSIVKEGTLLVQQNADPQIAQLQALQATQKLDEITYTRDKAQYEIQAVSKQQLDTDLQNLQNATAQVAEQKATVDKLTIRAPFSGRLGISQVYPGQYLNPGDKIVSLQSFDPIYADFFLPQQTLSVLKVGMPVELTADSYPDKVFCGKITTIEPLVDQDTRNVEVEATIPNPDAELIPGMFANVEVMAGHTVPYLTIPQSAVTFNPYGNIVFLVKKAKDDSLTVEQKFITTGEARGDQITVLQGLKEGDVIVSSGQIKLKNGTPIVINNSVQPPNNPNPDLPNEHGS